MGQFSWLDCITNEQIIDNKRRDVFVLIPAEFGGGHILEQYYDGYGNFGGCDVYALVARWNRADLCNGDTEHDREIGIDIACYDEDNEALKYPIKITHDAGAIYEECAFSPADPNQGWEVEKEYRYTFEYEVPALGEEGIFETVDDCEESAYYAFWDYLYETYGDKISPWTPEWDDITITNLEYEEV